jgi:hypothetical protein
MYILFVSSYISLISGTRERLCYYFSALSYLVLQLLQLLRNVLFLVSLCRDPCSIFLLNFLLDNVLQTCEGVLYLLCLFVKQVVCIKYVIP